VEDDLAGVEGFVADFGRGDGFLLGEGVVKESKSGTTGFGNYGNSVLDGHVQRVIQESPLSDPGLTQKQNFVRSCFVLQYRSTIFSQMWS
jgi:hypothetical protein